jgi:hypothetical protein
MEDEDSLSALHSFFVPEDGDLDPRPIAGRLVANRPEFSSLKHGEAVIMFLMRADPQEKQGRQILGQMMLPQFQGALAKVGKWLLVQSTGGVLPDFIMVLDNSFWRQATAIQREALVFHELLHAKHATNREGELRFDEDGKPVWAIRGHDLEEFNEVVRTYGAWLPDITGFLAAAREGGAV